MTPDNSTKMKVKTEDLRCSKKTVVCDEFEHKHTKKTGGNNQKGTLYNYVESTHLLSLT